MKLKVFGILGFDGGKAKSLLDDYIIIPGQDMQLSEDMQLVIAHGSMRMMDQGKQNEKSCNNGGGTAGCAPAHQFGVQGDWEIHIFEGGNELGAGVRTYHNWSPHFTFGQDIFLLKTMMFLNI